MKKKTLLYTLLVFLAATASVPIYDTIVHTNNNTSKKIEHSNNTTVNSTGIVQDNNLNSLDIPSYKSYLSTLSEEQLNTLCVQIKSNSNALAKNKQLTALHVGDFSQAQLPENSPLFWPRAYSPTNVEAFASTTVPTGRRPAEIYYAYGIDKITSKGAGQTVAIVVPAGSETLVNDLNTYSAYFGLPNANVSFVYPQGVPTTHSDSWALEATLDATMVHMIAPQAKILMVVCNTSAISGLVQGIDAAVAAGAKIVSLSWGSVEWSNQLSYSSHLNVPGVVFTSATGDSGYGTSWPSTEAGVIAVGGTQLVSSGTTGTVVEQVWSRGGGGISKYYSRPLWQAKAQSTAFRTTPDVSINASGYTIYMSNYAGQKGYINTTGTSASSPIIAGLIALGYSTRTTALPTDIHPTLYTNSTSFIKDIIGGTTGTGANAVLGTAMSGYDYATGLGVPNAPAFVSAVTNSK